MIVDVQFNSATMSWPTLRDAVLAAERAGFGVAWSLDHLAGQMMNGPSMLECFTLTGALAVATTTIGVGTLVVNVWNRPLGVLAVAAATAQQISGGRFWLGIGAGASPTSRFGAEHAAVGIRLEPEVATRQQRVSEFIDLARAMWRDGSLDGVSGFPTPPSPIPMIVGVNSESLARTAATRADGINVRWNHPRLDDIITAARLARAADASPMIISVWEPFDPASLDADSPARRRYDALGVDRLIVVPPTIDDIAALTTVNG